ncbi:hypothetical protein ACP4OV_003570 [Aristida adscensionis]
MAGAAAGDEGMAALMEQVRLASDLDLAFELQLAEAIRASTRGHPPAAHPSSSSHAAAAARPAAAPEGTRAHGGDHLERPLDPSSSARLHYRVFFKGMTGAEAVGPGERDPGVAALAVAVCGPRGEVVVRTLKPVEGFAGGRKRIEAMALVEGLHAALRVGVRSATIVTDYMLLHNHCAWDLASNTEQAERYDRSGSIIAKEI